MTKVEWSRAVLAYFEGSLLLRYLLGDLRPFADPAHDDGLPVYVALRVDRWTWRVQVASSLARRLLQEIRARTDDTAQLSADAISRYLETAAAFRASDPLVALTTVSDARFAVVLDEHDNLMWVGERSADRSPSRSGWLRGLSRRRKAPSPSWPPPPDEPSTPIPWIWRQLSADLPMAAAATPEPNASTAATSSARYLQGDLFRRQASAWVAAEPRLVRQQSYRLDVFIGPPGLGTIQASAAFRDDLLDWGKRDTYRLQVVFNEIGVAGPAQIGWIDLQRRGISSIHSFEFEPHATALFRGRISVIYEGRVLQTAVIGADVVESLEAAASGTGAGLHPAVEMIVRQDLASLDERRPFDVSLIMNHAVDGSAAMTAASREGAYVSSLDDLQAQLAAISELLVELANKSKIHTKGLMTKENAAWLGRLAAQGNFLFRKLVVDYIGQSPAADALRTAKHMQIVSARPDAVVPLEFVYEYPPPGKAAPVCPNAAKALEDGQCPEQCRPKTSPAACVCPMGFWGLNRVIERHVHDPRLGAPVAITGTEPTGSRKELDTDGTILLAVSEQVPKGEQKALSERIRKAWKGGVSIAPNWDSWPQEVETRKPALFVVLPHTSGKGADIALEIQGHTQECRFIDRSYVCPEGSTTPPIVLLLGCDTANVADKDAYTSNIAVFRQAGSAIVIATTAALVWGADAAKVAGEIMDALGGAITHTPDCFGEVLLNAKRRSVHDSQLMAMSLAAFGDADWRFKGH